MAITWSVSPNDGVVNHNNGEFNFPSDVEGTKRYTITYKDTERNIEQSFDYDFCPLKPFITADTTSVGYEGGDVRITYGYFDCNGSSSNEGVVLMKDEEKTSFNYQTVSSSNGVTTIRLNPNTSNVGGTVAFYMKYCETGQTDSLIIRQNSPYEVEIPESDYIVFNYTWSDRDGRDLDTITVITVEDREGRKVDKSFTGKSVGWSCGSSVTASNGAICLRHGGDNLRSGAEGAVICLTNIMTSGEVSNLETIKISIYANWYGCKKEGNATMSCVGYKVKDGYTPSYNDDISLSDYHFSNNPTRTEKTWDNFSFTKNIKACGGSFDGHGNCNSSVYTHVCDMIFDIAAGSNTFNPDNTDNGDLGNVDICNGRCT